jgi:hypothetical protein
MKISEEIKPTCAVIWKERGDVEEGTEKVSCSCFTNNSWAYTMFFKRDNLAHSRDKRLIS